MGLTIHWSLRSNTRSPKKARELVARLHVRVLEPVVRFLASAYELLAYFVPVLNVLFPLVENWKRDIGEFG